MSEWYEGRNCEESIEMESTAVARDILPTRLVRAVKKAAVPVGLILPDCGTYQVALPGTEVGSFLANSTILLIGKAPGKTSKLTEFSR